jgi:hypothetical protein
MMLNRQIGTLSNAPRAVGRFYQGHRLNPQGEALEQD